MTTYFTQTEINVWNPIYLIFKIATCDYFYLLSWGYWPVEDFSRRTDELSAPSSTLSSSETSWGNLINRLLQLPMHFGLKQTILLFLKRKRLVVVFKVNDFDRFNSILPLRSDFYLAAKRSLSLHLLLEIFKLIPRIILTLINA